MSNKYCHTIFKFLIFTIKYKVGVLLQFAITENFKIAYEINILQYLTSDKVTDPPLGSVSYFILQQSFVNHGYELNIYRKSAYIYTIFISLELR